MTSDCLITRYTRHYSCDASLMLAITYMFTYTDAELAHWIDALMWRAL